MWNFFLYINYHLALNSSFLQIGFAAGKKFFVVYFLVLIFRDYVPLIFMNSNVPWAIMDAWNTR